MCNTTATYTVEGMTCNSCVNKVTNAVTGIATAYGVPATRVERLSDLTAEVKAALSSDGPRLIEVPQHPLPAS